MNDHVATDAAEASVSGVEGGPGQAVQDQGLISAERVRIAGRAFLAKVACERSVARLDAHAEELRKRVAEAIEKHLDDDYKLERLELEDLGVSVEVSAITTYSRSRLIAPVARPPWSALIDEAVEEIRRSVAELVRSELSYEGAMSASWVPGDVNVEGGAPGEDAPVAAIQESQRELASVVGRAQNIRLLLAGFGVPLAVAGILVLLFTGESFIGIYLLAYAVMAAVFVPLLSARIGQARNEIAELKERMELRGLLEGEERRAFRLFQLHNLELKRYYDQALGQRRVIFGVGLVCILVGAGIAIAAIVMIQSQDTSTEQKVFTSGIAAVGAILTDFVAILYLRMFRDTVSSMNVFHNRLVSTNHLLFANVLAARISDDGERNKTLAEMAASVVGSSPQADDTATIND